MTWMGKAQQIRRQNMKVNAVIEVLHSERSGDCLDVSESLFTYSWRY